MMCAKFLFTNSFYIINHHSSAKMKLFILPYNEVAIMMILVAITINVACSEASFPSDIPSISSLPSYSSKPSSEPSISSQPSFSARPSLKPSLSSEPTSLTFMPSSSPSVLLTQKPSMKSSKKGKGSKSEKSSKSSKSVKGKDSRSTKSTKSGKSA